MQGSCAAYWRVSKDNNKCFVVVPVLVTEREDDTFAIPVFVVKEGVTADAERVDVDLVTEANEMPEDLVADTHIKAAQVSEHAAVHPVHQVTEL